MVSIPITNTEELAAYFESLPDDTDSVNHPSHYTAGNIECIDYIEDTLSYEEFQGYLRGCMMKYQHRMMSKGSPDTNLEKLLWYGNRLLGEIA
jgi:hypothetical protein